MLEFLFGNFKHFIFSVATICALIPFTFYLGCLTIYAITNFVTRGKSAIKPMSHSGEYGPWYKASERYYLVEMWLYGILGYPDRDWETT